MIVPDGQQRDSVIHVSILSQTSLPSRLPHNTEQSSLCYTVGPCWFSILNMAVCACQPKLPSPHPKGILSFEHQSKKSLPTFRLDPTLHPTPSLTNTTTPSSCFHLENWSLYPQSRADLPALWSCRGLFGRM